MWWCVGLLLLRRVAGLYEDQAGEFDWVREHIGTVTRAVYKERRAYVLSKANDVALVAALNARTGAIEWRRALPLGETGDAIAVTPYAVVTLSGGRYVRAWRLGDGALVWDAVMTTSVGGAVSLLALQERGGHHQRRACAVVAVAGDAATALDCQTGAARPGWPWYPDADDPKLQNKNSFDITTAIAMADQLLVAGVVNNNLWVAALDPLKGAPKDDDAVEDSLASSVESMSAAVLKSSKSYRTAVLLARSGRALPLIVGLQQGGDLDAWDAAATLDAGKFSGSPLGTARDFLIDADSLTMEPNAAGTVARLSSAKSSRFFGAVDDESRAKTQSGILVPLGSKCEDCILGAFATPASAASGSGEAGARVFVAEIQNDKLSLGEIFASPMVTKDPLSVDVETHGVPIRVFPHVFERKTTGGSSELGYRALVTTSAESLVMASKEKVAWVRDEGLASIVAVDFVDAPSRRYHYHTENHTHHHHHKVTFRERLELQVETVRAWAEEILTAGASLADSGARKQLAKKANAERYGFDKLAVVGSKAGRVVAITAHTGDVIWSRLLSGVEAVLTTREASVDEAPQVTVVSRTDGRTLLTRLDAHTGAIESSEDLGENVKAILRTGAFDDDAEILLGVVVANDDEVDVKVVPTTAHARSSLAKRLRRGKPLFGNVRIDVTSENDVTSLLRVFEVVEVDRSTHAIGAIPRGTVVLARGSSGEKVEAMAYGIPGEAISSKAHIMGDDALLLKYLNPHLAAVCTTSTGGAPAPLLDSKLRPPDESGSNHTEPSTLYVTLVDVVAARVVARVAHPNGAAPCHVSLSENWVVAAYWNAKAKRQELASLSLHEGMIDRYGLSPFKVPEQETSFAARAAPPPVALYRTFAVEKPILAVEPTLTARGIASKHFLVAVAPGQIAALDRRALDPRRPSMDLDKNGRPTTQARKKFERELDEGLHPYAPFVPLKPRSVITYTRNLVGLSNLFVTPAKLESTTLVLATGIDLYAAIYQPSGAFDLLADDFAHELLLLLLLGLGSGALLLRAAAKRKSLALLWA